MGAGERSQHAETWKRYDREFHRALIAACGSQVLLETHAQIYDRYLRYQMIAARVPRRRRRRRAPAPARRAR